MAGPVRWADILCGACTRHVLASPWTWGPRWQRMQVHDWSDCRACTDRIDWILDERGPFEVSLTPELSDAESRAMRASHEAGHAVVGLEFGYPMVDAELSGRKTADGVGGVVRWDFAGQTFRHDQFGAMRLAGAMAQKRWMQEQGRVLTDADRIDLSFSAMGDTTGLLTWSGGVPDGSVELAEQMVSDSLTWRQMQRVAHDLAQYGRLTAGQARSGMAAAKLQHAAKPAPRRQGPVGRLAARVRNDVDHIRRVTQDPAPAPPSASTPPATNSTTPTTHSGGNTAMSTYAEQARNALYSANQQADFVQRALQQAYLDLAVIENQLSEVSQENDTVQQVLFSYAQAREQIEQLQGLINASRQAIDQYATQW